MTDLTAFAAQVEQLTTALQRLERKLDEAGTETYWYSTVTAGEYVGRSAGWVRERIGAGDIPAHNIGTEAKPQWRMSRESLDTFIYTAPTNQELRQAA